MSLRVLGMVNTLRGWVSLISLLILALLPLFADAFYQSLGNRIMILAIAAISLNLILGFGGMISFGHAAFLGIGAYCVGIPVYYEIYDGVLHFALAITMGALFALLTGLVCLRSKGVYFIMITMAFAQMVYFAFVSLEEYGGDDGLVIELRSEFSAGLNLEDNTHLYYLTFVSLLICLYWVKRLVNSRFGRVIEGAKSNERRMQALGFATYRYRLVCYVIAGAMAGYAGALFGNYFSFISPEMMDWTRSGELIFMVVLGGTGSFFGPVLGAAVYLLLEELLSDITIYWHLIFGVFLILIVLFVRGGIDGLLGGRRR